MRHPRLPYLLVAVLLSGCGEDIAPVAVDRLVKVESFSLQQSTDRLRYPGELVPRYQTRLSFQ
ncbi:MAG: hypothetical protein VW985_08090, partial [Gammaproteobacteria bacterium]